MSDTTETKASTNGSKTKAGKGLKVERVYTKEGVHPYDELTWERRDVVLTNWRDGTVNFEQRGVEFPETWSVNAANIVTTKYFRGAVGTDAREWSLKQVIDRVVGTYVRAGKEHGYFASDNDAVIFDHELTHMLVHQIFAFNSPVWFNVGTTAPQQVSACQPYDSLVSTPAGLIPIGKLVDEDAVGTKVFDAHGLTKIVATKCNGTKEVLRLHTKAGYALDVTADHQVWLSTGEGTGRFVTAGSLKTGDRLEWHRREAFGEGEIRIADIQEAALAGWLQSDGFVGQYDQGTNRSLTIEAVTVNDGELAWVTNALNSVFTGKHRHERSVETIDESLDCRRTRLYGEHLRPFVERWGLLTRGREMEVPAFLFDASLPVVTAYLRSIFQAEGYVSAREASTLVAVDMVSEKLIRGIQSLLLRFGIFSRVSFKKDGREGRQGGIWTLRIQNDGDREIFEAEIGFVDEAKSVKLLQSFAKPGRAAKDTKRLEIASIESIGEMTVYDIQTESGEYLSGNLRVHNCFILAVDDTMDSILNWYREEGIIFKGGSGAGLNLSKIRSSKELLSSGGTASGPVSFMRGADASAGTIKSGGATRRAAKMVILDVDHPDIEEFIDTKAREEDKIRALRDAGFDMDLGGKDIISVQYQNANNSVRVNDEFMRAVEAGEKFGLKARATGEVIEEVDAQELWTKIAKAAWECADPGLQFDDTINDWHTCPESGRITASNPCCFTGDTLVSTVNGPVALELLIKRVDAGESLTVQAFDVAKGAFVERSVVRGWEAGRAKFLVEVRTSNGLSLRCTPEHRFLTDAGWVEASTLAAGTRLVSVDGGVTVFSVTTITLDDEIAVYDIEVDGEHNFVVAGEGVAGVVVHNSEYMHLDNSSCNLASLNLMTFRKEDGSFDSKLFSKAVALVITAMDISICFADFPTEAIGDTTRAYRQLGIGYANLGALLMSNGLAYDSDAGRAMAGAISSLMQATAYKRSAELAGIVGPYDGYARNATAHKRVVRKHAAANDALRPYGADDTRVVHDATKIWQDCIAIGESNGYRNSQASVIAPTGCLTADTLIASDRGLTRLSALGDEYGPKWQDLDLTVSTDEGPRNATKFFINGEEETRRIITEGGYRIQGTLTHRIKVIAPETGAWEWKRLAEVAPGDVVPMQLGTMVGEPRRVPLPVLDQAYYGGDHAIVVPNEVDADLAELVGYFMGDGSLHAKGIRFCVADTDLDLLDRFQILGKGLFNLEPTVTQQEGYHEVMLTSMRLARWWQAAGFAKTLPTRDHIGKGWHPRVPAAILESNDAAIYAAFVRGLFEADGTVSAGVQSFSTSSASFAYEIQTLMLTIGLPTTLRETVSGFGGPVFQIRLRNIKHALNFAERVGFMSDRKQSLMATVAASQSGNRDRIHLPASVWLELAPIGSQHRAHIVQALGRGKGVSRDLAESVMAATNDARLGHALGYIFEVVGANEDGGVQPTYDLSVPDNVTYVAGGFVSHNTIGLMMDCDTTGLEPDLALVKMKKLVGGASMKIVNQTVPMALRKLGYEEETVEAIVEFIAEHGHVVDAPGLKPEHYSVFDCAMGERSISPMGHIRMMAAIQPFISGALSKTVNLPETATIDEVAEAYLQSWKLGLKAVAIYRNNCKVGQPLQDMNQHNKNEAAKNAGPEAPIAAKPRRERLPKTRMGQTVSFAVAGAEGYMTSNAYEDTRLGEVFIKMSKQGSTLAGVMDAFSVAVSIALQYGVPLEAYVEKFMNMRFEPAGITDDPDVRMATSMMDYIFRRLALDYLPEEKRTEMGIFTAEERAASVAASYGAPAAPVTEVAGDEIIDTVALSAGVPVDAAAAQAATATSAARSSTELAEAQLGQVSDAPICFTCGTKMRPAGACYVCEGCGSTSGCS